MPKISVIIPTYNCVKFVGEAIDSVLAQTYRDFEIIVIDDGSVDGTGEMLTRYGNKIKYLYQYNKGSAAARNYGIKESNGQYLAFLDADDIWLKDKLKLQVKIFEDNPAMNLVFTDAEYFSSNGVIRNSAMRSIYSRNECLSLFRGKIQTLELNSGFIIDDNMLRDLLSQDFIVTPTVIIKKDIIMQIGLFDEDLRISEDYHFWIRAALKLSFTYVDKITTKVRVGKGSCTGIGDSRVAQCNKWNGVMFEKILGNGLSLQNKIRGRTAESYRIAAWGYMNNGNSLAEVRKLSMKSLKYDKKQPKLYLYILISFLPIQLVNWIKERIHCNQIAQFPCNS